MKLKEKIKEYKSELIIFSITMLIVICLVAEAVTGIVKGHFEPYEYIAFAVWLVLLVCGIILLISMPKRRKLDRVMDKLIEKGENVDKLLEDLLENIEGEDNNVEIDRRDENGDN